MTQIVILHPGEMGAAIGSALSAVGNDLYWLPHGRGPASRLRAHQAGLQDRTDVLACDAVISICPPQAAVATAKSVGRFTGLYLDANAISPSTAGEVARILTAAGGTYVDGGVIGPPPTRGGTTRIYLSGRRAGEAAAIFANTRLEPRILEAGDFAASSMKMCYAAWTKISAALTLAARGAANELGVGEALNDEWALSQPGLDKRYEAALASAEGKGWRWVEEMRQVATTFSDAGQPGEFGQAAAAVFARFDRPESAQATT